MICLGSCIYWGCGMFGRWDVREVGCTGGGMFGMWDVREVGCSGGGMFGRWDVRDVGCSGCGMFGMWDVGCGMFAGMWYVDLQNALLNFLLNFPQKLTNYKQTKVVEFNKRCRSVFYQEFHLGFHEYKSKSRCISLCNFI